jgi:hypothetical protein
MATPSRAAGPVGRHRAPGGRRLLRGPHGVRVGRGGRGDRGRWDRCRTRARHGARCRSDRDVPLRAALVATEEQDCSGPTNHDQAREAPQDPTACPDQHGRCLRERGAVLRSYGALDANLPTKREMRPEPVCRPGTRRPRQRGPMHPAFRQVGESPELPAHRSASVVPALGGARHQPCSNSLSEISGHIVGTNTLLPPGSLYKRRPVRRPRSGRHRRHWVTRMSVNQPGSSVSPIDARSCEMGAIRGRSPEPARRSTAHR